MKDLTKLQRDDSAEFLPKDLPDNKPHKTSARQAPGSWKELYQRSLKIDIKPVPIHRITVYIVETSNGKNFTLADIHPMDSIGKIKQRLSTKADVPVAQLVLLHQGEKLTNNTMTIQDAGIEFGNTLELQRKVIFVQISKDQIVTVPMEDNMELWEVQQYLEDNHEIYEDELLGFDGLVLDEPERSLGEYKILENSELVVIDRC